MDEYNIKYVQNEDGVWAYLQEDLNAIRFGKTEQEAFVNLMMFLHGGKD